MPTTVTLSSKYLEDSQGNKFAPITTPNAVRWPNGDNLGDKLTDMGASGTNHKGGLVPDTPSVAGNTKFLREDATWADPLSRTINFYPVVNGVEGISSISSPPEDGTIVYDYLNDAFYYYDSGSPVQFAHPTWDNFLIQDGPNNLLLLSSNGVITDVTQNPPYDIYVASWNSYNTDSSIVFVTTGGQFPIAPISFSNINTTSYSISLLGLPVGVSLGNSLANIPTTYNVAWAVISANQSTVSIDGVSWNSGSPTFGDFTDGKELHVFVMAQQNVTITLPTALPYVLCGDDSALTLDNGEMAEINFVSTSSVGNIFVKAVKSAMTYTMPT